MSAKFELKLIRKDISLSSMLSINDSMLLEDPIFTRKSLDETINDAKVQYARRDLGDIEIPS